MDQEEKQKPIPTTTTGGKPTAGHSHYIRSKAKRTSHSDDSSASESHQPPLKRQTRQGTKQDERYVGTNNDNSAPIDSKTVDEYTSPEIALRTDLVLETLFRYMNGSDLLSCRIVNKQWQDEATKELRRRNLVIRFSFQSRGSQWSRRTACRDICRCLRKCRTPSSLLSSFQVETVTLIYLGSAEVTNVLTTVGNQLKHLTLHLNYAMNRYYFAGSSLRTALQNLLFRQAPNLEFLEIKFDFHPRCEAKLLTFDVFRQNEIDHNDCLLLPNLKTFIVRGSPAPKFLADVINAAVNLRSFGGAWSAVKEYLLGAEGRAKIHLLKSLSFEVAFHSRVRWNQPDFELVETFLTEQKQNPELETFECLPEMHYEHDSAALRTVRVINRILEWSSGSLQKLTIEHSHWRQDVFIRRLPQLQEIGFDCFWSSEEGLSRGFFPLLFNMNTSFPNVSSIVLLKCSLRFFCLFVRLMKIEITEPVPSIRYITVIDKQVKKSNLVPPLVTDLRLVFPNLVSISYVDSNQYYNI